MEIIKIGILSMAGVMLALQFKVHRPEISFYIGFAISAVIFSYALDGLFTVLYKMQEFGQYLEQGSVYYKLLFKAIGITYIGEFCAAICKDAGYHAVAGQIEVFGNLSVLFMGLPILLAIIENISAFAG